MTEETPERPKWLDRLEKQRELRLQHKLGHEAGAGSPCLNCKDKCSGLDLHFWRKICKICKCGKDEHDFQDDDVNACRMQFDILGARPVPKRNFPLRHNMNLNLDWTPAGTNLNTVTRYLREMPNDLLPVSGTPASKKRLQKLQHQLPAHDMDATLCDALTPKEQQQLVEYVSHVCNNSAGQGHVMEMSVCPAITDANMRFISEMLPTANEQVAQSEPITLKPSMLAEKLQKVHLNNASDAANNANSINNNDETSVSMKCHECDLPIDAGALAINATKRTSALWHPNCFKCHECKQLLADLLYFYSKSTNNIYCLRDYAQVKGIPRCKACDELIFSNEFVIAEERTFHVKHFCCWECDAPLGGQQYVMAGGTKDEQPVCLPCYNSKRASVCRQCDLLIGPDQQGATLQSLHWHVPNCFVCRNCSKNLMSSKVLLHDQHIYCSAPCIAIHSDK